MQEKQLQEVTFYLYDYSNNLVQRTKKIYSPYNVKTLGRTITEDDYIDPDFVEFKNWQYTAKRKELWNLLFEQQVEWLGFYNPRWGMLSKWWEWQKYLNGRMYKNNWFHKVVTEKIQTWPKTQVKTVTERVEVQQIPEIIAKNMNVAQLQELAAAWNVELPDNLLELGDVDVIKKKVLDLLRESWKLS